MKVVEPSAVNDIFVTDLQRVDVVRGGFARFVLCVVQAGGDGQPEMHVKVKIVMPMDSVPDAIMKTAKATALGALGFAEPVYN